MRLIYNIIEKTIAMAFSISKFYGKRSVRAAREDDNSDESDSPATPVSDDGNDSDYIVSEHNSESEAAVSDRDDDDHDDDEEVEEEEEDANDYYNSKSGKKWKRVPYRQARTTAINIVSEAEGVNPDMIQLINGSIDAFRCYITDNMIQLVTLYTNEEIERATFQYVMNIL